MDENETWFRAKEEFPRFYQSWLGYSKRMTDWAKESQWDGEGGRGREGERERKGEREREREREKEMDSWEGEDKTQESFIYVVFT